MADALPTPPLSSSTSSSSLSPSSTSSLSMLGSTTITNNNGNSNNNSNGNNAEENADSPVVAVVYSRLRLILTHYFILLSTTDTSLISPSLLDPAIPFCMFCLPLTSSYAINHPSRSQLLVSALMRGVVLTLFSVIPTAALISRLIPPSPFVLCPVPVDVP